MKDRNGIHCCEEIARIGERGDITIRQFNGPFYLGGRRAAIEAAEWASKLG